ncbi:MAG: glycosyltransferase family 4 protein [Parvibaculum sp.]|uniref:glycosyltransferase family 4 protein n=1 Tax=Parvibaculum sp. TaxID=2024848 RepID=UPI00271BF5A8|nr:glycosyltransferase family 4 protein [Parvibaculum sp.]MDO8837358.1 glycosyltransferase family 4 protein [Parvibaculum sp.]
MTILHIANWYPNPWDSIEGNFVRDQIRVFAQDLPAETIVVQVRPTYGGWPRLARRALEDGARGYFLLAPVRPGKMMEWLSTLLLVAVLLREKAWRFEALHFHIAYPLLLQSRLWRWMFRKPIMLSEHWSAYHYNFHLPDTSRALRTLRKPFRHGYPVFAVSQSLLDDIRRFAQTDGFRSFVIPNVVPLHGPAASRRDVPVLFAVNRWVLIKNPLPMLEGLNQAALAGHDFKLVIGGYGEMIGAMTALVDNSALRGRTTFVGKMTKPQIAAQLAQSDGYLFSSDYETFSIACAEALGAGVPLIGPYISSIAEYAGPEDWIEVPARSADGWSAAILGFVEKWNATGWNRAAIAQRAARRFSETVLRARYRAAMQTLGLESAS